MDADIWALSALKTETETRKSREAFSTSRDFSYMQARFHYPISELMT